MDKKLLETIILCVEIMNSKRQVLGKLGHVVQIRVCRLTGKSCLQSSQVKRTPQDYIIRKLNLLVVVDFRFISAFLHA